ncbi:hypothetical protein P4L23_30805, partial [Bacillus cereus]|nr:hypothetical protein [Bacillus cereus]
TSEKDARKADPQESNKEQAPMYIIMDKKLVGEAVSEDVDNANKRRTSRLAQFNPQVTPAF